MKTKNGGNKPRSHAPHKAKPQGRTEGSKPQRTPRRGITNEQIEETVKRLFESEPNKVFNYKQICYLFGTTSMSQKRQIVSVLEAMAAFGVLEEVEMGRFRLGRSATSDSDVREGIITFSNGYGSFVPDGGGDPEPIGDRSAGVALSGDRVRVKMSLPRGRHHQRELEVVKILERSDRPYVGTISITRGHAFFVSEQRELRQDIYIPTEHLAGAQRGDKVLVRALGWSPRDKNPFGEVVDILGKTGDNDTEMNAILAEFGLPYTYPQTVIDAAEKLSGEITPKELKRREDFREVLTMTIDPRDAKDFDDALSLRQTEAGLWEVGVHIADVSHFVQPGDIIDREAYARATSIYLVDRTIPMLPERLSNDLCSLRPLEDKYSYSCVFELNDEAEIKSSRIVRSVIRSDRRFTYEEAQEIIETKEGDHKEAILQLNALAQILRQKRFAQGSIAFDRPEVRFEIDETGKPISIYVKESLEAHQLIEEFMLLANKTVAERIGRRRGNNPERPFVYRVHDAPDLDKLSHLSDFAARLGYKLKVGTTHSSISKGLNSFLADIHGHAESNLLSTIAVRAMAKAIYTTENIGHYGLAFKYYSHFTSPIRRYPDLMAHRLLTYYLIDKGTSVDKDELERQCDHSSAMENLAAQAERASIRYKQVEYMSQFLGQEFDGVVTGVAEWGIYVELEETKCEGMIPARDLTDDYYTYDASQYSLIGRHTSNRYTIGDKLRVQVAQTNLERKLLDFALVGRLTAGETPELVAVKPRRKAPSTRPPRSKASRQPATRKATKRSTKGRR